MKRIEVFCSRRFCRFQQSKPCVRIRKSLSKTIAICHPKQIIRVLCCLRTDCHCLYLFSICVALTIFVVYQQRTIVVDEFSTNSFLVLISSYPFPRCPKRRPNIVGIKVSIGQPGGHVSVRPPRTCICKCSTV